MCCLNCLHSVRTEYKFKLHEKLWENKDYKINVVMPSEDHEILEFNEYQALFIIHADLECFIKKVD